MSISIDMDDNLTKTYDANYNAIVKKSQIANNRLLEHNSYENNMTGWLNPTVNRNTINRIELLAERIKKQCDIFIVIGAGGSYLGAKA
ncbi:MAG: hypothetical protein RR048_02570, partial [Oscillospiraceae bacterium]